MDRLQRLKDLLQRLRKHRFKHTTWIEDIARVVHNAEFFVKFKDRINMWEAQYQGQVRAPIIQDETGRLRWLNREMRKQLLKRRHRG